MPYMNVDVSEDEFFASLNAPGIIGPSGDGDSDAWVAYCPGETPCICNSFDEATKVVRDWLATLKKPAKKGRAR